ncbi:MAG TPA: PhoH family protein, partial [Candidatus Berkiella sp.]|nr:PhoH family protein [Candidatus Berkiella sp.]
PVDNRRLMNLCGRFDEHLRQIERRLHVEINNRGSVFQILGERDAIHVAHNLINKLYAQTENGEELTPAKVHLVLQESYQKLEKNRQKQHAEEPAAEQNISSSELAIKTRKGIIKPHSKNQRLYLKSVLTHDINFGIGPAGTGKTYLAVACAVAALEAEKVKRVILVRPAVEAGERLGFLPGDLSQKIDPYLRPLYDALYEMLGFERVSKLIERNVIELAPLAYMRGRTLNDAFIIVDEAQNTTTEQMKMFLTRLGFGSTAVITGDITQIDLPGGVKSGLKQAIAVLQNIPGMSFTFFESIDVVRHPIVQKIVEAYEKFHNEQSKGEK